MRPGYPLVIDDDVVVFSTSDCDLGFGNVVLHLAVVWQFDV
jgi:hypothetical protein